MTASKYQSGDVNQQIEEMTALVFKEKLMGVTCLAENGDNYKSAIQYARFVFGLTF